MALLKTVNYIGAIDSTEKRIIYVTGKGYIDGLLQNYIGDSYKSLSTYTLKIYVDGELVDTFINPKLITRNDAGQSAMPLLYHFNTSFEITASCYETLYSRFILPVVLL